METRFYIIRALSPLHVGSGDINFGLIDNLIQRDPVTDLPIINAPSLKGALREHFEKVLKIDNSIITNLFGSEPNSKIESNTEKNDNKKGNKKNRKQGRVRFFEAFLLSMPVRCSNTDIPYLMATSQEVIDDLNDRMAQFELIADLIQGSDNLQKPYTLDRKVNHETARIEDLRENIHNNDNIVLGKDIIPIFGENSVIVKHSDFKMLTDNNHLPVISRNCLDNDNPNLWYEQILPRYSRLGFFAMGEADDLNTINENLEKNIQIGANATIGYGYCEIENYSLMTSNENQKSTEK